MAIQDFTAGQILTAAQMDSLQANDYNWTVSTKTANYTLVAADKGTRIQMNKSGAATVTVNDSLFNAGDTLIISNISADAVTVTAGTATVAGQNLVIPQYGQGTLFFSSASASIFFLAGSGSAYGTATGGIGSPTAVTIGGVDYEYLQFNSTGTLTVTKAGFFDYLLVGGGGGSMKNVAAEAGGGGGAGQLVQGSVYLSTNQTVTIGAGGAIFDMTDNQHSIFTQGGTTSIGSLGAALGNVSGAVSTGTPMWYVGGACGGSISGIRSAVTESDFLGYYGGTSSAATNGGGGGGSRARGGNATSTTGGTGGTGFDVSAFIGGSALFKAMGGGGGGSVTGGTAATGGVAGTATTTPPAGNANSGGGGGGGYGVTTTGAGGSGIAYIRYGV